MQGCSGVSTAHALFSAFRVRYFKSQLRGSTGMATNNTAPLQNKPDERAIWFGKECGLSPEESVVFYRMQGGVLFHLAGRLVTKIVKYFSDHGGIPPKAAVMDQLSTYLKMYQLFPVLDDSAMDTTQDTDKNTDQDGQVREGAVVAPPAPPETGNASTQTVAPCPKLDFAPTIPLEEIPPEAVPSTASIEEIFEDMDTAGPPISPLASSSPRHPLLPTPQTRQPLLPTPKTTDSRGAQCELIAPRKKKRRRPPPHVRRQQRQAAAEAQASSQPPDNTHQDGQEGKKTGQDQSTPRQQHHYRQDWQQPPPHHLWGLFDDLFHMLYWHLGPPPPPPRPRRNRTRDRL